MKRSTAVRRILLGGFSAGAIAASVAAAEPRVTPENYYTNDYHLPGVGYYHAPFRAFFPQPYNHFDPARRMYFYGGQWGVTPYRSIVNISAPTPEAAQRAETRRTDLQRTTHVPRAGFGSTSGSHSIRS
ncbi:MAG: hypothetical protein HY736_16135 [Verrucomicrobia bacterium]|nr:hypothetical protein [Verrucomicrobiota bacterium]